MRKTILATMLLLLSALTAKSQSCFSVTVTNGTSTYQGISSDGKSITADSVTSGADSMTVPPGCPIPSQFSSATHTAYASLTIASGNQLQNPNFTSGSGGWNWGQAGSSGGWSYVYAGRPNGIGNGYTAMFSGTGTAALTNLQQVLVVPGQALTASAWGVGEPGALGQALLRIDWYGSGGNLLSISNGPTVTNNYAWQHPTFTATAPAGAAYAHVDFAVINKTTTTGRWFVYGFASSSVKTANSAADTGCYSCYLDTGATVVQDIGSDTDWTLTYDGTVNCSMVGTVFSLFGSINPKLTTTYGYLKSVTTDPKDNDPIGTYSPQCTNGAIYASCPNGIANYPLTITWGVEYGPTEKPYINIKSTFFNFQLGGNQCILLPNPQQAPSTGGPCT